VAEALWLTLAAKMAATAGVVVLACLLVERAGPMVGGLIATLPISAGPGFVFLAMEHDAAFIGASALGGMRALTATTAFITLYALLAPRLGLAIGLGGALAGWGAMIAAAAPAGRGRRCGGRAARGTSRCARRRRWGWSPWCSRSGGCSGRRRRGSRRSRRW
jgi:uncharacterized membrane protein (GlpM family)